MNRKADDTFDPSQPTLIVTYGNTTRKHRQLDRDVLIIGQNRSCDIGLVSPEVAPIHCLLSRGPDGWRIRDCGSRCGTRVNGKAIQDSPLHDGDAIQIGPFSFQAHLPGGAASNGQATPVAVPVDAVLPRLQRSRRNLARLALRLRRKNLAERAVARQNGVIQQADTLKDKFRECAARAAKLEEEERALTADRARHQQEVAAFEQRVAQREKQIADEEKLLETSGAALSLANEMEAQRLAEWRRQLEEYAGQLEQTRQGLLAEETRLATMREQIARERQDLQERQVGQRQLMSQAEAQLREQRDALTKMMGELKRLHQEVRSRDEATIQLLRKQNEEMRAAMAQQSAAVAC
jgi:pSer/pThr/pTyr-binding forkhead associated (FHA) protein